MAEIERLLLKDERGADVCGRRIETSLQSGTAKGKATDRGDNNSLKNELYCSFFRRRQQSSFAVVLCKK